MESLPLCLGDFILEKSVKFFLENFVIKLRCLNRQTILKVPVILKSLKIQISQWDRKRPMQGKGKGEASQIGLNPIKDLSLNCFYLLRTNLNSTIF